MCLGVGAEEKNARVLSYESQPVFVSVCASVEEGADCLELWEGYTFLSALGTNELLLVFLCGCGNRFFWRVCLCCVRNINVSPPIRKVLPLLFFVFLYNRRYIYFFVLFYT